MNSSRACRLSRRRWLEGLGAAWLLAGCAGAARAWQADDPEAEKQVRAQAEKAGIKELKSTRTTHYFGIGNAPDRFRLKALQICESLARDYLSHFKYKGFNVHPPRQRLTVVTLADARSYAAFSGQEAAPGVGGYYDIDTNHLVIFDNRPQAELPRPQAEQANLVSLAHEAMHQLTFNTGLLDRAADVPVALSEGLAAYAEVRRPVGATRLGQVNQGRLDGLRLGMGEQAQKAWIPLEKLLTDDKLFAGEGTDAQLQLAYGESWLFVFEQLKPIKPTGFRDYLEAIRARNDATHRLEDAREHLGSLKQLDQQLHKTAAGRL